MKPTTTEVHAGDLADGLIRTEIQVQDMMWGDANERADTSKGQLLAAGITQAFAVQSEAGRQRALRDNNPLDPMLPLAKMHTREDVFTAARNTFYPPKWNGFRDYGSDVANLVVAAAYIRNEIKRRIADGESITRSKRGQPYAGPDKPAVSSEDARNRLNN